MSTDLVSLDGDRLKELVATMPANKRAAFAKAAKAACQYLRNSKADYARTYEFASAMVENWWRLGVELNRLDISQGSGMKKRNRQGDNVITLSDLGIDATQSARCQKLAEWSKSELEKWLAEKYDEEKYYLPSLRPAAEGVHVANNSGETEWYTPPEIIEAARAVLGEIELDPCTSAVAQQWIKATKFYTVEDDGLGQEWHGRIWMNPPYESSLVVEFTQKLAAHYRDGSVEDAIVLVNNATETKWFQDLACLARAACFLSGRVKFLDSTGEPANTPLQGQCVLYLGDYPNVFYSEFAQIGLVLDRVSRE